MRYQAPILSTVLIVLGIVAFVAGVISLLYGFIGPDYYFIALGVSSMVGGLVEIGVGTAVEASERAAFYAEQTARTAEQQKQPVSQGRSAYRGA